MADRRLKIWYDRKGDFLEVMFEDRAGYFRETDNDQVMQKVDDQVRASSTSGRMYPLQCCVVDSTAFRR